VTGTDGSGFPTRVKELYSGSDAVEMSIDEAMTQIFVGCCHAGKRLGEASCKKIEFKIGEGESKIVSKGLNKNEFLMGALLWGS